MIERERSDGKGEKRELEPEIDELDGDVYHVRFSQNFRKVDTIEGAGHGMYAREFRLVEGESGIDFARLNMSIPCPFRSQSCLNLRHF
jgi:hypothetical protein